MMKKNPENDAKKTKRLTEIQVLKKIWYKIKKLMGLVESNKVDNINNKIWNILVGSNF